MFIGKSGIAIFMLMSAVLAHPDGGNGGQGGSDDAVTVTISFESQIICTDDFFNNQLNSDKFAKFAKCPTVKWAFEPCEESHLCGGKLKCPGDSEDLCQLDRMQACVAQIYKDDQVKVGTFVTCMMNTREPKTGGPACGKLAGIEWSKIDQCLKSGQGDKYCDDFYKKIQARKPKWIPSIMFDGKYDDKVDTQAKEDFSKTLCEKLKAKNLQCDAC